jgi:hypothetical protein
MFNGSKIKTNSINLLSLVGGTAIAAATLALTAGNASAATIFNLDSTITSGNLSTPTYNFGTVTLTQNGNKVDVSVALNQAWKILTFNLNYAPGVAGNTISSSNSTISFTSNGKTLGGAGNGAALGFDIELPNSGNIGSIQTFLTTLSTGDAGGLTEANFLSKNAGGLFAGIHIANNNLGTLPGGVSSIAIGSVTQAPASAPVATPAAVPEPLTILGAATAAGFGASFKRRLAKAKGNQKAD